jgi:hypothetical protein
MSDTKPTITSKTLWFNSLVTAMIPILKWQGVDIPPEVLTSLVAIANIILRLVTNKPLQS